MPRKLRQLRADLRAAGFVLVRTTGSHEAWEHPLGPVVTLAGRDGSDAQFYQERQVRAAIAAVRAAQEGGR
jgi:predicted RNA binding protein YcfA (HicA-like mRNA interferase family)